MWIYNHLDKDFLQMLNIVREKKRKEIINSWFYFSKIILGILFPHKPSVFTIYVQRKKKNGTPKTYHCSILSLTRKRKWTMSIPISLLRTPTWISNRKLWQNSYACATEIVALELRVAGHIRLAKSAQALSGIRSLNTQRVSEDRYSLLFLFYLFLLLTSLSPSSSSSSGTRYLNTQQADLVLVFSSIYYYHHWRRHHHSYQIFEYARGKWRWI